jgi:hypothetical protein
MTSKTKLTNNKKKRETKAKTPISMARFFLDRINEREVEANESLAETGPSWGADNHGLKIVMVPAEMVLAECTAHRKMLEHALLFSSKAVEELEGEEYLVSRGIGEGYLRSIRFLVAVHHEHPEFRREWIEAGE